MESDVTEPRATTASVDRRVERLENQVSEIHTSLATLGAEQSHLRELMTTRFTGVEALITAQGSRMDAFISKMDLLIDQSQRDPINSNPVAKAAYQRLEEVEMKVDGLEAASQRQGGAISALKVLFGGSVLGAVVAVVSILVMVGGN